MHVIFFFLIFTVLTVTFALLSTVDSVQTPPCLGECREISQFGQRNTLLSALSVFSQWLSYPVPFFLFQLFSPSSWNL